MLGAIWTAMVQSLDATPRAHGWRRGWSRPHPAPVEFRLRHVPPELSPPADSLPPGTGLRAAQREDRW